MRTILVIANQTLGGAKLLDRIKEKVEAAGGDARVVICVPRVAPHHGNIIYEDAVFEAAQVRVDLARRFLRELGINAIGEVGDPDPYTATMDAIEEYQPAEVIISTLPTKASSWMRRGLVDRIKGDAGVPVEHVVIDLAADGISVKVTLVVANRTAATDELLECLNKMAAGDEPRVFIACVPQEDGHGAAAAQARARKAQIVDRIVASGHVAAGIVGDPDPYTATMNAVETFSISDIVISTLPATRSGWMRSDLIRRVENASGKPVVHVEVAPARATSAA